MAPRHPTTGSPHTRPRCDDRTKGDATRRRTNHPMIPIVAPVTTSNPLSFRETSTFPRSAVTVTQDSDKTSSHAAGAITPVFWVCDRTLSVRSQTQNTQKRLRNKGGA